MVKYDDVKVEEVRAELLGEAAERAADDPEYAARLRRAMRTALERVAMPRVMEEPTPIRQWATHRKARFSPVQPAGQVVQLLRSEFIAAALGGELPSAETVAQLAALVDVESRREELVAAIALVVLPIDRGTSDEKALLALMFGKERPRDLETLINAALVLEFAAAHLVTGRHVGRLLALASLLWWTAGQAGPAARALKLARHWAPTWSLTERMVQVLRHRPVPDWMHR